MAFCLRMLLSSLLLAGLLSAVLADPAPPGGVTPTLPNPPGLGRDASAGCRGLQQVLGTSIVQTPTGPDYEAGATAAWNLQNSQGRPACVVFPESTNHVALTMSVIFRLKIRYAVIAGGHTGVDGWNSVQNGILFNLSRMKAISYNATSNSITLQPGIRWGEALTQLESHGVAPLGGRLPDVGTGLLLGGGLSYLSPQYGYSSDAYREVEVVLVNGTVVTANALNRYSDLFRALKGGANRFGIVTRYEVDAVQTGTQNDRIYFGGMIQYPPTSTPALLQATRNYVANINDPKAAILMLYTATAVGGVLYKVPILVAVYKGSSLPPSVFQDFLSIPSIGSQLSSLSYNEAMNLLGPGDERGSIQIFGASVLGPLASASAYNETFSKFDNYTEHIISEIDGVVLAFTPVPRSQVLKGREKGWNIISPPLRNFAAIQIHTKLKPGTTSVPPLVANARRRLLNTTPRTPGFPLYVNECAEFQNVFETYGRYEELKRTYRKYDPTRFNVRFTNGPIGL